MAEVGPIAKSLVDAGANRVHLPASPLMHGTGAFTTFQALFLGAAIVTLVGRHFDPHELWETVQRERVTQMAIVGDAFAKPMLRALEEAEAKGTPYDISSLQIIISSGVMWSAEVKHGLMERGNFICYDSLGSSEGVGFAGSISAPGAEHKTAKFSIGDDAEGVQRRRASRSCPGSGEVGRLAVGGHIPLGYYKDEAKSDATFLVINGARWSVPGDFASVEADGTITLLGRGSVVINSGGEKIFPEEVEEAVKVHPAVADCLVVGVPDERFGEAVTAVVSLRPGEHATADELAAALEPLARFKRPRRFVIVDEVVRGPNGKADYKWAKAEAATRTARARDPACRPRLADRGSTLGRVLLLLGARLLREHVARAEDQEVLAVDGDLGAAVLRVHDGVADPRSIGMSSPLFSARRPGPIARTSPCWGFSFAVSGMTRPLWVVSSASAGRTTIRSSNGCRFIGVPPYELASGRLGGRSRGVDSGTRAGAELALAGFEC